MMLGAKAIASTLLVALGVAGAWLALGPAELASIDQNTLFWIGVWASIAGPVLVWFWRLHEPSRYGFGYSREEDSWEGELDFLRVGAHRIVVSETPGATRDFPALVQVAIYIGLAFLVGLVAVDARALVLLTGLPEQASVFAARTCPDPDADAETEEVSRPGCALIRRAYALGYADDLGSCAPREREVQARTCNLRHHDEPWLHYAWRLTRAFWSDLASDLGANPFAELVATFLERPGELEKRMAAQRHVMGTGPRAAHHIWTNLPAPRDWLEQSTGEMLKDCLATFRRMPHRPALRREHAASQVFEHVVGKLLFEPRYSPPAGYCREYTIHWGAPLDTCERMVDAPGTVLDGVEDLPVLFERYRLTTDLDDEQRRPLSHFSSLSCFMVDDGQRPERRHDKAVYAGQILDVTAMRVPVPERPEVAHVEWYGRVAALLARGFHYGKLSSEASTLAGAGEAEATEALFDDRAYALSRLDYLEDVDIFLGHTWILEREDLRAVYPYHLHLKNFVNLFRRQYTKQRGRL